MNAADAWVDASAASYNSALLVQARSNLSAKQKVVMLVMAKLFDMGV